MSDGGGSCRGQCEGASYTFQLQTILVDELFNYSKGATQYALIRIVFALAHNRTIIGLTLLRVPKLVFRSKVFRDVKSPPAIVTGSGTSPSAARARLDPTAASSFHLRNTRFLTKFHLLTNMAPSQPLLLQVCCRVIDRRTRFLKLRFSTDEANQSCRSSTCDRCGHRARTRPLAINNLWRQWI